MSFFRAIQDPEKWPVFIYCWKGDDRAGFYVAAYRMVIDGWNSDDAIRELFQFHYNPIWFRIPGVLRDIDVEKLKAGIAGPKIGTAPETAAPPSLEPTATGKPVAAAHLKP